MGLTYNNLAILMGSTDRPKEAEAGYHEALALFQALARDFPAVPKYRLELARTQQNLADQLKDMGRAKEAEAAFRDALARFESLVAEFPTVTHYQCLLATTLYGLAELARDRKEHATVRQLLEQARPYLQKALGDYPRDSYYRQAFCYHRELLAATLLELGDHAGAAVAAADLARIAFEPANDAYKAACFLARCIGLAQKDKALPQVQRQELARSYGDQAVQTLRQALAKGYKDIAHLQKDKDLEPLRDRDDFKKLLAEVESKSTKSPLP
jgi:tetratricopeptide (TPR) repeat protein